MPAKSFVDSRLGIALASVILLPTLWYVGFNGSSYALGTLAAALVAFGLWLPDTWVNRKSWHVMHAGVGRAHKFVLGALICQSIAAIVLAEDFQFARFGESIAAFLVLVVGAVSVAGLLEGSTERAAENTFHWITWALMSMAFAGTLGLSPMTGETSHRTLFIFSEPSHFVLIFAPFLLWSVVKTQGVLFRGMLFASVLILLLLIKSMILLMLVGLAALVALRIRALALIAACLVAIVMTHPDYFLARLDMSDKTFNLSVLVWLQGWQDASMALKNTDGVGLGFQQLGLHGAQGDVALRIARQLKLSIGVDNGTLNLLDGGTLGAKLSAEFGILGIAIVIVCSYLVLRSILKLRVLSRHPEAPAGRVFLYCCIASFALDLFVRGTGYFGPWVLLSLAGLYGSMQADRPLQGVAVPFWRRVRHCSETEGKGTNEQPGAVRPG